MKLSILLVAALIIGAISVAGCTSSTQQPINYTNLTEAANMTTAVANVTPTHVPTPVPTTTPTATPGPTLTISGPSTIADGQGGVWIVYINGQLPTAAQQITWNSGGLPGAENSATLRALGTAGPLGSWSIDANGAATTAPGTYTLTATYQGASSSFTVTRLANPTATPYPTLVNPDINHDTRQWVSPSPTPYPPAPEPKR